MIIIGATSGIGAALARQAYRKGYIVGGTGRRIDRLKQLRKDLGEDFHFREMDVVQQENASEQLLSLIEEMGGMDIIVIDSGIANYPASSVTSMEQEIIDVNVSGFVRIFGEAFQYFRKQGHGHIVGVSSIAGLFGAARNAPYSASKAFISTYMQGYRNRCFHSKYDITITDVKPGFVESEMTEGKKGMFWVADTDKAVHQMLIDIEKKKKISYITRRWRFIAWVIKLAPNWLIERI
jgi:short-subunit dehydrogenase